MESDQLIESMSVENELEDIVQEDADRGGDNDDVPHVCISEVTDVPGSLVGIVAKKWEDLYELYRKHSQAIGFSIRKSGLRRANHPGTPVFGRYFVCSCEGQHGNGKKSEGSTSNGQEKKNVLTRCFCKAKVRVQAKGGVWEVLSHVLEHNHPLTPPEWQHHHRSERKITDAEGEFIEAMTEAMVPASVQFRIAAQTAGGDELVGHTQRDHINFVHRLNMKKIEGGDASTLMELLTARQAEDPRFFFRVQFGKDGRLCNVFWRDSMMKEDYLLYHHVVIFDTTYRTNRYNFICGAFDGINNHWSNVMFGFAFLSNEQQESFEWLFKVFNESMGLDSVPVSIFTD